MSLTIPVRPDAAPPNDTDAGTPENRFGLTVAVALIMGSIIGVGIFNLPTSLAAYGPISPDEVAMDRPPTRRDASVRP